MILKDKSGSLDLIINSIYDKIRLKLLEFECKTVEDRIFLKRFLRMDDNSRSEVVKDIVKSQSRIVRDGMDEGKDITLFGIGSIRILGHNKIIYDLACEVAKEFGYDDLRVIKNQPVFQEIRKEVDKRRAEKLKSRYKLRRKVSQYNKPAILINDFRKGESLDFIDQKGKDF